MLNCNKKLKCTYDLLVFKALLAAAGGRQGRKVVRGKKFSHEQVEVFGLSSRRTDEETGSRCVSGWGRQSVCPENSGGWRENRRDYNVLKTCWSENVRKRR